MKHKSEIVWCDQRDLRMKKGIKLTRKTSLYDLIKVTNVWVSLGHTELWKLFHKLQCLGHFKAVDMSKHYNHTLLDIEWSRLSPTVLPLLFRFINLIGKHSLQYREPSEFMETNTV